MHLYWLTHRASPEKFTLKVYVSNSFGYTAKRKTDEIIGGYVYCFETLTDWFSVAFHSSLCTSALQCFNSCGLEVNFIIGENVF